MSTENPNEMDYTAPKTIKRFMESSALWRLIIGPFGSGKSSGCTTELLRWMIEQAAWEGVRHTRFAIIRNSYRELKDTTLNTVQDWFPSPIYNYVEAEATMYVKFNDVESEILFRALDTPADVKKLLSLDLTAAWINEAREVPRQVFKMLKGRVGRYPSVRKGGATKRGIWMDTNPPDSDHWIHKIFEEQKPEFHEVFHQPSGLSPEAENIKYLPGGRNYYTEMMAGEDESFINVYVHGEYGFVRDGKPVYPEFKPALHVLKEIPKVDPYATLILGMDFGLTPTIVVIDKTPMQYRVVEEYVAEDSGANMFAAFVKRDLAQKFPHATFRGWGDPAGAQRAQTDEQTPFDIVQAAGLPIDPTVTNDFIRRREAVAGPLLRLNMAGQPWLMASPKCVKWIKAHHGGYHFKRVQVSNEERYMDLPNKNEYSHIADATQYGLLGEGEDFASLGKSNENESKKFKVITSIPRRFR